MHLAFGQLSRIRWPIACMRCVLPNPTPPWMKRGLYTFAGESLTAKAAAWAKRFDGPTMNSEKV